MVDIHDVVKLKRDLVDIDNGLRGKVTLCKDETGTFTVLSEDAFIVEFTDGVQTIE